jgi:hypothetical protein
MTKKTQEESEQPAKVYQLDALSDKFDNFERQANTEFADIKESLKTLLLKTDTQVTPQQLNDNLLALDKKHSNALDEEVKKIHLEYSPVKKNISKALWLIVGTIFAVIGQLIVFVITLQSKGN